MVRRIEKVAVIGSGIMGGGTRLEYFGATFPTESERYGSTVTVTPRELIIQPAWPIRRMQASFCFIYLRFPRVCISPRC